jgi:proteic killer suppression protein
VRFIFKKKKIEELYTKEKNAHKYPNEVVDAFFEVMAIINAAVSEQDLYAFKGLRFEKLSGQRGKQNQRSLRLNQQWRLIVVIEEDNNGNYLLIVDIVDYH